MYILAKLPTIPEVLQHGTEALAQKASEECVWGKKELHWRRRYGTKFLKEKVGHTPFRLPTHLSVAHTPEFSCKFGYG